MTSVDSTSDERTVNNVMRHEYRVLSAAEKEQMKSLKDAGLFYIGLLHGIGGTDPNARNIISGNYGNGEAIAYTVLLLVAGMADNVLKPLMLGRGVDAPMPVILIGALGGMATAGILGMFVGATLLALGYQIFMSWVANNPDALRAPSEPDSQSPN